MLLGVHMLNILELNNHQHLNIRVHYNPKLRFLSLIFSLILDSYFCGTSQNPK